MEDIKNEIKHPLAKAIRRLATMPGWPTCAADPNLTQTFEQELSNFIDARISKAVEIAVVEKQALIDLKDELIETQRLLIKELLAKGIP